MSNPDLILLDELSLGLAPIAIKDIYEQLPRITAGGMSAILVEQDVTRALGAASHFICMQEGRVSLEGAPKAFIRDQISAAYFGTWVMDWLNAIEQGILVGGIYAMFAARLSLIFGVMRLVNIAHGDLIILGSYVAWAIVHVTGLHPLASLIVVVTIMAAFGYALQRRILNRPLGKDILPPLLAVYITVAALTSMVGCIIFLQKLRISPDAAFSVNDWIAFVNFIVVIGGIGTIQGPILGTIIYFMLGEYFANLGSIYLMVLGALAIIIMLRAPKGIWAYISKRWNITLFPVGYRINFKD